MSVYQTEATYSILELSDITRKKKYLLYIIIIALEIPDILKGFHHTYWAKQ